MSAGLNETQDVLVRAARKFADEEMAPYAAEWDRQCIFPIETLKKAASLGFAGLTVKEVYGGSGLSRLDSVLIFEELATACPSTAAWLSIHNMVASLIEKFGNKIQQTHWLPLLC